MKTRKQYLDGKCTHSEYYAQFVDSSVIARVTSRISKKAIMASTDPHMNDIPLKEWDSIPVSSTVADKLKECGDFLTLAGCVCINKAAARQIRGES